MFCAVLAAMVLPTTAKGAFISVYGGPAWDETTSTGYELHNLAVAPGSPAGNAVAVGTGERWSGGTFLGQRGLRWDASGAAATELGNIGTDSGGFTNVFAFATNSAGATTGYALKYSGNKNLGERAVRWDASGTAATELGNLGTSSNGSANCEAYAINSVGAAVGQANKYTGGGAFLGWRAVRWGASGTAVTELGNIGTDSSGYTNSHAYAINSTGAVAGFADKFTGGTYFGQRAVRWDASGTVAAELDNLGTDSSGYTINYAYAINNAGTVVGSAYKYSGGTYLGDRAVRWDASGTAATELGNLGTSSSGVTGATASAINGAGTAVGFADKYTSGTELGYRAVRWDASGAAATELGNLGTDASGNTDFRAYAINSAGFAVGYANRYSGNTLLGRRAVLWNFDAIALDLNTLIDPASGWTLTEADGISDTNWVTGIGSFDPDGSGPLAGYDRAFLLNVSTIVPEPAGLGLLAAPGLTLLRRRRRGRALTLPAG